MAGLRERWNGLSRAMQWAAFAAVGFGLYFAVLEPVVSLTSVLNEESNLAAERLKTLREQAETRSEATAELERAARVYGGVLPPGTLSERENEATRQINAVLSRYRADGVNFSSRSPVSLGSRVLPEYVENAETQELRRVTIDVSFTATPERVIDIIAEIERIPEITLIADVRLTRASRDRRLIEVNLAPEVWGVAPKGRRG